MRKTIFLFLFVLSKTLCGSASQTPNIYSLITDRSYFLPFGYLDIEDVMNLSSTSKTFRNFLKPALDSPPPAGKLFYSFRMMESLKLSYVQSFSQISLSIFNKRIRNMYSKIFVHFVVSQKIHLEKDDKRVDLLPDNAIITILKTHSPPDFVNLPKIKTVILRNAKTSYICARLAQKYFEKEFETLGIPANWELRIGDFEEYLHNILAQCDLIDQVYEYFSSPDDLCLLYFALEKTMKNYCSQHYISQNMHRKEMIEIILRMQFERKTNIEMLHNAVSVGDAQIIKLFLENGENVDGKSFDGATPLMHSLRLGYIKVSGILLHFRADVNARNSSRSHKLRLRTPLMEATYYTPKFFTPDLQNMRLDVDRIHYQLNLLKRFVCRINSIDKCGRTALMMAVKNRNTAAAMWLVENGAQLGIKSADGKIACDYIQSHSLASKLDQPNGKKRKREDDSCSI